MVARCLILMSILINCLVYKSYAFQTDDSLARNHQEITFSGSILKVNTDYANIYSASYAYQFRINKRFEIGPSAFLSNYDINNFDKFYLLGLRAQLKFYFGDLLKSNNLLVNSLYANSKVGFSFGLKETNFNNSDQYILGLGTSIFNLKNRKKINFEIGASEISLRNNNYKIFENVITFGLSFNFL